MLLASTILFMIFLNLNVISIAATRKNSELLQKVSPIKKIWLQHSFKKLNFRKPTNKLMLGKVLENESDALCSKITKC